jgi:hypothetical protein
MRKSIRKNGNDLKLPHFYYGIWVGGLLETMAGIMRKQHDRKNLSIAGTTEVTL